MDGPARDRGAPSDRPNPRSPPPTPTLLTAGPARSPKRYNTPTIANAIEIFNVRGRHLGFLPHQIRCLLPRPRADRRLRGDLADPRRAADRAGAGPDRRLSPLRRRAARARRSPSARTSTTRRASGPSSARSTRRSTRSSAASATSPTAARATSTRSAPSASSSSGSTPASATPTSGSSTSASRSSSRASRSCPGDLIHADKHGVCLIPLEIAHQARRRLRRGRAAGTPLLEHLPVGRLRPGGVHPPPGGHEGQDPRVTRRPGAWGPDPRVDPSRFVGELATGRGQAPAITWCMSKYL